MRNLLFIHLVRGSFSRAFKCIRPSTNLPPTTNIHFVILFHIFSVSSFCFPFSLFFFFFFFFFISFFQHPPTFVTVYPMTLVASFRPM
ncbi:hypothetical protein KSS87_018095, partial [Heliosperma pusillum]